MNKNNQKDYNAQEVAFEIKKALYKSILKSLKNKRFKNTAKDVVEDVLDRDDDAEINPANIPHEKENVVMKNKVRKGIDKLKRFIKKKCMKGEPIPGLSGRGN